MNNLIGVRVSKTIEYGILRLNAFGKRRGRCLTRDGHRKNKELSGPEKDGEGFQTSSQSHRIMIGDHWPLTRLDGVETGSPTRWGLCIEI